MTFPASPTTGDLFRAGDGTLFEYNANGAWQSASSGVQAAATLQDLIAETNVQAGQVVQTLGYYAAFDSGGGTYEILATGTPDGGSVVSLTGSGLFAHLRPQPANEIWINQFGGGPGRTGAENTAAIEAMWDYLVSLNGGTINLFSENTAAANMQFNHGSAFQRSEYRIKIKSNGFRNRVSFAAPVSGQYMWTFEDNAPTSVTNVELQGIQIQGDGVSEGNGIQVQASNNLYAGQLFSRQVIGTAFWFKNPNNAEIDHITTFESGDAANGRNSLQITGSVDSNAASNDIVISGTTENDSLGWLFEGVTLIRTKSSLKLHGGGNNAGPCLSVHRSTFFDLDIMATSIINETDGQFVLITDLSNSKGITLLEDAPAIGTNCRGQIRIANQANAEYTPATGTGSIVEIDNGGATSVAKVAGTNQGFTASGGGTVAYVRYTGTGNAAARVDLSAMRFLDEAAADIAFQDDRSGGFPRPNMLFPNIPSPAYLFAERPITGTTDASPGDHAFMDFPETSDDPRWSGVGHLLSDGQIFMGEKSLAGSRIGPLDAVTSATTPWRVILPQDLILPRDAAGNFSRGLIHRMQIGGTGGINSSLASGNYWQAVVRRGNNELFRVDLVIDQTSAAAGDGYPSRAGGNANATTGPGYRYSYWQGIDQSATYLRTQQCSVEFEAVGAPNDLQDVSVRVDYLILGQ